MNWMQILTKALQYGPIVYQFIIDYKNNRASKQAWKNLTPAQQQQVNQILPTGYADTLAGMPNILIG